MATVLSDQLTKVDDGVASFDQLKPNEHYGRLRVEFFKYTTPTAGLADGDIVALCDLPKGARILRGVIKTEALGTSVVGKIGITGSDAKYLANTSMAAISSTDFAITIALNYAQELTALTRLILTLSGAAPAGTKIITGHVEYVVD